jgi:hypothetical protein
VLTLPPFGDRRLDVEIHSDLHPLIVIGLTACPSLAKVRWVQAWAVRARFSSEVAMDAQDTTSLPGTPRSHRRRVEEVRSRRYEPSSVYMLAEHLKREGVELDKVHGPWYPIRRPLRRLGRNAQPGIPIVTNGVTQLAVDTAEHAADVSGLLNWCGVDRLEPVPNLRPPDRDLA